jgi:hypothetical protein
MISSQTRNPVPKLIQELFREYKKHILTHILVDMHRDVSSSGHSQATRLNPKIFKYYFFAAMFLMNLTPAFFDDLAIITTQQKLVKGTKQYSIINIQQPMILSEFTFI